MKLKTFLFVLLAFASSRLHAQFMEYKPLPVLLPNQFLIPSTPSVMEEYEARKRSRLELEILKEQRDLLRSVNGNKANNTNTSSLITFTLLGANTADEKLNPKSEWTRFTRTSFLTIDKTTNEGHLYLPDFRQDLTFDVLDLKINQGNDYAISTLELESDGFLSVLNIFKEDRLWILWGTKGDSEIIVFQSPK